MNRTVIRLLTIIPTLVIALAGFFFTINIDIKVNVGVGIIIIFGIIWAIAIIIDERNEKITNAKKDLQKLNDDLEKANEELKTANEELEKVDIELEITNEQLEKTKKELEKANTQISVLSNTNRGEAFCLKHRSTTVFSDFLNETQKEIYITGIINNGAITTFINDKEIFEMCCQKKITVRILFYVSDNEEYLKWYLRMIYGEQSLEERIDIDKGNYRSCINDMDHRDVFCELKRLNLLETKRLDVPGTTAFIASDINSINNGKIQCQFYQFKTESRDCPVCLLNSYDEMFPEMRDVILDMWKTASPILNVDYIENVTIRADSHK